MNFNKSYFILIFFILILSISAVSANEIDSSNVTMSDDISEINSNSQCLDDIECVDSSDLLKSDESGEIIVNDWDELQYYCSLTDKDYTLRLKENTNFYPSSPTDSNYQIKINNNVKIIGSMGSYIGDSDFHRCYVPSDGFRYVVEGGEFVTYAPIVVPDKNKKSLTLENITFKWIYLQYSPDAKFLQLDGGGTYVFRNCNFDYINTILGNGAVIGLKRGSAILDNCSFVNCTIPKGLITISEKQSMVVSDCYFANNFAYEHTTCIMNWGKLTIYNTKFYKNRSAAWAGGITTYGAGITNIYNSNFTGNVAGWNGGALYVYNIANIYNTTFMDNNCTTNNGGGAIGACKYSGIPRIYIEDSLFKNNNNLCWALDSLSTTGTGCGGAISLMDEGSLEVRNSLFIANSAAYGTAINARDGGPQYGSPDVIIVNNTFINHTRAGDVLYINLGDTFYNVSGNNYFGNSIEFSNLTLTSISSGNEQATLKVTASLARPDFYEQDILNRTLYDVYINNEYVKTVNTTMFTIDFGDLDICDVYVIPTISNRKTNAVTVTSTREYVFVSKNGSDDNGGRSRDAPVKSIKKALELAQNCKNILILDGDYSESLDINYDVTIKGEGNALFTNQTSFNIKNYNFTLKRMKINNLNIDAFISESNGAVIIENCIFENNHASKLIDGDSITVSRSIFNNNDALLINNQGFSCIKDSIILNNTNIIQGSSNYSLDYNWWGSTLENPDNPDDLGISNWIVLNAISNVNKLENNHVAQVQFGFYLNNTKYLNLPEINLKLTPINGTCNINITPLDSIAIFTLTGFSNASLIVEYNNIKTNIPFEFLKSNPNIGIKTTDVMFGDDLIVQINTPNDADGNLTVTVGNNTQKGEITGSNTIFTFNGLKAGSYIVNVSYSGDKKYLAQNKSMDVNVNKYSSAVKINLSEIKVNEDLFIQVGVPGDAAGNVSLYINNEVQILTLNDAKVNYTVKSITRGDYVIAAVYNGDEKYLSSSDSIIIEVDNLNSSMEVSVDDIVYGESAVVNVKLNDNATGNVSVSVGDVTNSTVVVNGQATIRLSNLEAGVNKTVTVFYSGDDTYFNRTEISSFTISKANLTFNMSCGDIMIGQDAVVKINVPAKTSGTFTIGKNTLVIPLSGSIEYVISDLEIGEYEITATYDGNNYHTVSDSTSFKVSEYPAAQWPNQGFDTRSTGKSIYETMCNGEIYYTINFEEEIIGDLTVDSNGNIYLTTSNGIYSYDNQGNFRYVFISDTLEGNFSGTAIGRDVVISPKSGDKLYFINQTTGEKYGSSNIYQASSVFAPIVDSDANIYVMSEYQVTNSRYSFVKIPYKAWEFGGEIKSIDLGKSEPLCSPTLTDDIIVIVSDGRLMVLDTNTLQSLFIKSGEYANVRPVIGEGNVIYAVLNNYIVAYSTVGSQIWKTKVTGGIGGSLVLDDGIGLYTVNAKGNLYRYDLIDGSSSKVSDLRITTGILIGSDGTLYVGCDNVFYALDADGNILWKSVLESNIKGSPIMDKNGSIYLTTEKGIVLLTYAPLKDPNIIIDAGDVFVGEDATVNISIDKQCLGDVIITVDCETYTGAINCQGIFTKTFSNLKAGVHNVSVEFGGDLRFANKTVYSNFTVSKYDSNLTSNISDIFAGETLVFEISLPLDATGNVIVNLNNQNYSANKDNNIVIDDLPAGDYNYTLTYVGDAKYASKTLIGNVSVVKADTTLTVEANDICVGEDVIVNVKMPTGVTGNVTANVDGKNYSAVVNGGIAQIAIPDLKAGNYSVSVNFTDDKYADCTNTTTFTVSKVRLKEDILSVDGIVFTLDLPSDATGTLTVNLGGKNYTQEVLDGWAILSISGLAPGNYIVHAGYNGDEKYESITFNDTTVNIEKLPSSISVEAANINVGDVATVNITTSVIAGNVIVSVAGRDYNVTVDNYAGRLSISNLTQGNYTVIAEYWGDDTYGRSLNATSFSVLKVEIQVDNETITVPQSDAVIYSVNLPNDATGTLTVTVDGTDYTSQLVNGKATVNIPEISEGTHNITVTYSGDGKYAPITESAIVTKNPVVRLTGSDVSMLYTSGKYFKVRLTSDDEPMGGKTVKITINGKTYSRTTDKNGYASFKVSLPPKTYSAKASYENLTVTKKVVVKSVIKAKNINAKKSAKTVKVKVSLKKVNGKYLKNKKVTLKFNKKTFKAKTNKKGVVTFTIKKNVYAKLKTGKKYTYQVVYGKDKVKKTIKFKK